MIWGNLPSPHPHFLVLYQTDFSHWSEVALFSSFHSFLSLRPLLASLPTRLSSWLSTLKSPCNWHRLLWNFQAINLTQQSFWRSLLKKKKRPQAHVSLTYHLSGTNRVPCWAKKWRKPPFIILFKQEIKNSAHTVWKQTLSPLKPFSMFIAHYKLEGEKKQPM